jgi:hypothetical protein
MFDLRLQLDLVLLLLQSTLPEQSIQVDLANTCIPATDD